MRVLFYHAAPEWDGRARWFAAAARALVDRGYQVTYTCPPESAAERRASYSGFEVIPLETGGSLVAEAYRLRHLLRERFVEVVCVHTEREQLVASMATRLAERGAVLRRTPAGGVLRVSQRVKLAGRLAANGYVFTTQSDYTAAPSAPRSIGSSIVPIGVDTEVYDEIRPAPRSSLGAGGATRLAVCLYDRGARERVGSVLRTVAMLAPRHPDLRLALLGAGSDHEDLRMHAAALGVTGIVSHLGERDDALAVMRAADIGWIVAGEDDAVYGALDFMAMRIPVLGERGSVVQRYVADGITGILLPPGDPPSSAAAMATFLAYEEQRSAMGNAGRVRVAREHALGPMAEAMQRAVESARDRSRWQV